MLPILLADELGSKKWIRARVVVFLCGNTQNRAGCSHFHFTVASVYVITKQWKWLRSTQFVNACYEKNIFYIYKSMCPHLICVQLF